MAFAPKDAKRVYTIHVKSVDRVVGAGPSQYSVNLQSMPFFGDDARQPKQYKMSLSSFGTVYTSSSYAAASTSTGHLNLALSLGTPYTVSSSNTNRIVFIIPLDTSNRVDGSAMPRDAVIVGNNIHDQLQITIYDDSQNVCTTVREHHFVLTAEPIWD